MYIFTLGILSILSLIEIFNKDIVEKRKIYFLLLAFSLLVFHDGFRWQTGCDWDAYSSYFENFFKEIQVRGDVASFEPLYNLFMMSIRIFTDNYSVYLIIHALIFYVMVFWGVFKLSPTPFTSLMLLYMIIVPYMGTNRQLLVLGLYFIALYFLQDRKWLVFVIIILTGFYVHHSALLCLVALLCCKKIKLMYLAIAFGVALLISFSGIINLLSPLLLPLVSDDQFYNKMDVYNNLRTYEVSSIVSMLSLARKMIWLLILICFDQRIKNKDTFYNISFNMYFIGILFYVLFNGTVWQQLIARGMMYFSVMEIFIIPYVLALLRPNYGKLCVVLLLPLYCWLNITKGFSNYGKETDYFQPYKGLFINTDYVRQNTD